MKVFEIDKKKSKKMEVERKDVIFRGFEPTPSKI
jgi:hypothetical protein